VENKKFRFENKFRDNISEDKMSAEDDDLVFPWEEGAQAARPQVNFGVPTNPVRATSRKNRRSSILKQPSADPVTDRAALQVNVLEINLRKYFLKIQLSRHC
jgi:hypothetical protein